MALCRGMRDCIQTQEIGGNIWQTWGVLPSTACPARFDLLVAARRLLPATVSPRPPKIGTLKMISRSLLHPTSALRGLTVLLVLFLGFGLVACSVDTDASEPDRDVDTESGESAEGKDEALPVAALPLGRGPIESVLRYSSNLEAERSVAVLAEAARRVTELRVEEGRWVQKGQVLIRLQDEEQKNALAKAQSQYERALREYQRQERLFKQELISEQAFSEATYDKEQLEIEVADAQRELDYATVRAPISGTVTARNVNIGNQVQVGQELFQIVDFQSLVARVFVPEKELKRLAPGQGARVAAQAAGIVDRPAEILRIAPTVDSRSGTVKVTLAIPDKESLRPGMFVEIDLVAETDPDALLVPKRALVYDEDQTFVYRVVRRDDEDVVERLLIEVALESKNFVKVPEDMLSVGDRIVVAGQAGLKDGVPVRLLDLQEAIETFGGGDVPAEVAAALE